MSKPTGVSLEFDNYWKAEAIKIAMQEQLNIVEELDLKLLFKRAKNIYVEGYQNKIHTWHIIAESMMQLEETLTTEKTEPEKTTTKIEPATNIPEHLKQCPACGELVNKNWEKHTYKSNGDKCGHAFTKK